MDEARTILAGLMAEDRKNYRYRYNMAFVDRRMGDALAKAGQAGEAQRHFEQAASLAAQLLNGPDGAKARGQMVSSQVGIALLLPARDPRAGSLVDSVAAEVRRDSRFLGSPWAEATIFADLGGVYRRLGRYQDSAAWYEKSCARWRDAQVSAPLEARRQRELASAEAGLAAVRQTLH